MKALLVEPSRLVALMLSSMFGKYGIETVQARSGADALEALAHHHIDLLCFAYELGDMNGVEFFSAAKSSGLLLHQPALLFASTHDKQVVDRALVAGVTECFAKNRMRELDAFVGKIVQSSTTRVSGTVLLVEDSKTSALYCRQALQRIGLKVEVCTSAEQAVELFAARTFDLVLTDYVLAGTQTGLAVIQAVRGSAGKKASTPIVVMSSLNDTTRKIEILRNGANDFIAKPAVAEELELRIVNLLTSRALMRRLESQHAAMQDMAMHDQLTGLFNRHYLQERLPALFADCQRKGQALTMAMCDIDHFKRINDAHGHKTGDHVLEEIAATLSAAVHGRQVVARVGGEEFLVVLPDSTIDQARDWAESLRAAVALRVPAGIAVTVSIGLAERRKDEEYEALFKRADAAVYKAKEAGRNRVELQD